LLLHRVLCGKKTPMSTSEQSPSEIREHLAEQLDWRFAERNDAAVAQALYSGEAVDGVHTLDEAGLLDGFFAFLQKSEVMAVWQGFRIDGVQRIFLPTIYFVLLYGTRVLFGIESSNALPVLLFTNVAVIMVDPFVKTLNGSKIKSRPPSLGELWWLRMMAWDFIPALHTVQIPGSTISSAGVSSYDYGCLSQPL
jgi:hypothetical protein